MDYFFSYESNIYLPENIEKEKKKEKEICLCLSQLKQWHNSHFVVFVCLQRQGQSITWGSKHTYICMLILTLHPSLFSSPFLPVQSPLKTSTPSISSLPFQVIHFLTAVYQWRLSHEYSSFIKHNCDVNDIKWCFRRSHINFRDFQVLQIVPVSE